MTTLLGFSTLTLVELSRKWPNTLSQSSAQRFIQMEAMPQPAERTIQSACGSLASKRTSENADLVGHEQHFSCVLSIAAQLMYSTRLLVGLCLQVARDSTDHNFYCIKAVTVSKLVLCDYRGDRTLQLLRNQVLPPRSPSTVSFAETPNFIWKSGFSVSDFGWN